MDEGLKCRQCKRSFKTERGLQNHEATHQAASTVQRAGSSGQSNELRCLLCGKSYKTLKGLQNHAATHKAGDTSEKVAAALFQCSVCDKTYKTANGLKKHSVSHTAATGDGSGVNADVSNGNDITEPIPDNIEGLPEYDIPDDDEPDATVTNPIDTYVFEEDDEVEEHLRNLQLQGIDQESNGAKKKEKKKALVKCPRCKYTGNTIQAYLKHKSTHVMSDLYAGAPSTEYIISKSSEFSTKVLGEISNLSSAVSFYSAVRDLAKVVLIMKDSEEWTGLVERMVQKLSQFFNNCQKFVSPSELRFEFQKSSAKYIADTAERKELATSLKAFLEITSEVANLFLGSFLKKLSNEVLVFYMHYLIHNDCSIIDSYVPINARFALTSQPTDNLEFKQLMHFIGGSNVKSILRGAYKIKNPDHEWLKVIAAVKTYFISGELATAPDEELRAWTETQDRGGLIKISDGLLKFYLVLAPTVKFLEHLDGSLYIDEVMEKVLESNKLVLMWSDLLRESLSQESCFKLLHALCTYFCNTWRRGIISRRLDEMSASQQSVGAKHGMSGVAFRAAMGN